MGTLCSGCQAALPARERLLPEHVTASVPAEAARGWLVDQWGRPHPVGDGRTSIGRSARMDISVLDRTISSEHAAIECRSDGWRVRDLGSRNATQVDGQRVDGRAPLAERATIVFGGVGFYFIGRSEPLVAEPPPAVETADASNVAAMRMTLSNPGGDAAIVLLRAKTADADGAGSLVMGRRHADEAWSDLALTPMEIELLFQLSAQRLAAARTSSPMHCVASKRLARTLPFQSRYAGSENVRQLVRRLRKSLEAEGFEGIVDTVPGRGYQVTWNVESGAPASV